MIRTGYQKKPWSGSLAGDFARGIVSRYAGRKEGGTGAALTVLRLVSVRHEHSHFHHAIQLHLTQRIGLSVLPVALLVGKATEMSQGGPGLIERITVSRAGQAQSPVPTGAGQPPDTRSLVIQTHAALVSRTEQSLSQVFVRMGRPPVAADLPPSSISSLGSAATIPPARRVVLERTAARNTRQPAAPLDRDAMATHQPSRQEAQAGPPATTPGRVDLNRLTDQVIQAIDRRIIAERERMGRI